MQKSNYIIVLILNLFFQSCQFFEQKVPKENELLQKQLNEINWKEVDEYPSVNSCDSFVNVDENKKCFFNFVSNTITEKLINGKIYIMYPKIDTLTIKVTIFPNSDLYFETQNIKDSLIEIIKIDSVINSKLVNFPKINPSIKRGIPVKTQFILPVIIKPVK